MVVRKVALAVGLVFAALGFLLAAAPGFARTLQLPEIPTVVVGGFALALGLATYLARRHTEFRDASDDERRNELLEGQFEPPRPGAAVDAQLSEGGRTRHGGSSDARFNERLRQLAVQVLVDARAVSREEAHEQLDDGTWTENTTAASFFSREIDPPAEDVVGAVVGIDSMYERQAHNAVVELKEIAGLDVGES
jgi:membrane protein implicated in regulation of membrane protease activity